MDILFISHIINFFLQSNGTIFIADRLSPASWGVCLPDLDSRLKSIPAIEIRDPDDNLLISLLKKLFLDRQIKVNNNLLTYVIKRIERSFESINHFVEVIDERSLKDSRPINISLASEVLEEILEKNNTK